MELSFRNSKLAKVLNSEREILRNYGTDNGRRIMLRLSNIRDAATLEGEQLFPRGSGCTDHAVSAPPPRP